jgi:hypothetical protein
MDKKAARMESLLPNILDLLMVFLPRPLLSADY